VTDISPKEYRAILRSDFYAFTHRSALELHPSMAFQPNWHLEVMSQKLDAVRRGEIKRLIITIPPRHLKSICGSVCLPAYFLGHDPTTQIISASYGQNLADKLARDCRSIMTAPNDVCAKKGKTIGERQPQRRLVQMLLRLVASRYCSISRCTHRARAVF
jgi:hypothetical protein